MSMTRGQLLAGLAAGCTWVCAADQSRADAKPDAQATIAEACALAGQEGKSVLVVFFASWCAPCHLLEQVLDEPQAASVLNQYFRIVRMRVDERDMSHRSQQLRGAEQAFLRYAPRNRALPFFVALDANARLVTSSICPTTHESALFPTDATDLDCLDGIFVQAAPTMSTVDRAVLRASFSGVWAQNVATDQGRRH